MKNSKKVANSAGQSTVEAKSSLKRDANLQKNSTLYFQIGLILSLMGTYALFEMQFAEQKFVPTKEPIEQLATIDVHPIYREESSKPKEIQKEVVRQTVLIDKYDEVKDDIEIPEAKIITPDAPDVTSDPVDVNDIIVESPPNDPIFVDFVKVEIAPVYPGCEKYKTNGERKDCMSKKISRLINKKFDSSIANEYGITGMQRIYTQFTVDKNGVVTDVKIRGPHPALEKEAERAINKIPDMQPGKQGNKAVGVIYTLPIAFKAGY